MVRLIDPESVRQVQLAVAVIPGSWQNHFLAL
ncbi:hypothetical protein FOCG_09108 [Fusarium oxysporum f. sp. radicis-lycopersici 26381]|uniref:Uncharacterized protein n=1 Tax=Fusarium oxysporum Fo47 TaxID=660027 RepID=W9KBU5_FUSOX|nr:hypothetical protein FOZG_08517 [Fusarium oxysporum Fo47]EWZ83620.1 hypothetical protein FOWG_12593 [Fusarium oxysporum f. sp. lycopersici MN25]EXL50974.1 hypothetical protein FOCG_09108 [Fusarium oxysporum f. sp. radicis-lycopersici 26381]